MKKSEQLFLEALKASLLNKKTYWDMTISAEDIQTVFKMAEIHHVNAMIYEAVYGSEAMRHMPDLLLKTYKKDAIQSVSIQTMKSIELGMLNQLLRQGGVTPCIVKGIICRSLYPNPDARISGDEDIHIPSEQFKRADELMREFGMSCATPTMDIWKEHEVPYFMPGRALYVELHKNLFSPKSEAYGNLNRFFEGIHDRLIEVEIDGEKYLTMNHTEHLLYLICHSFKHFLHSGFGIRQVCDITLFANKYGRNIDWEYILDHCLEIRADLFAAALFKIGEKYLTFDPEKACYPDSWSKIRVDETAMLNELLASGVFGQSNMSRKHSSNITLSAVIANKRGEKAKSGTITSAVKAVFLSADKLSDRYTYLKKMPFLLPVAWIQRVWTYKKETSGNKGGNNAVESIKIGNERIELMKQYGIIK